MIKLRKRLFIGLLSIILILPAQVYLPLIITVSGQEWLQQMQSQETVKIRAKITMLMRIPEIIMPKKFLLWKSLYMSFDTKTIESDEIYEGSSKIDRYGVNGLQKVRYDKEKRYGNIKDKTGKVQS